MISNDSKAQLLNNIYKRLKKMDEFDLDDVLSYLNELDSKKDSGSNGKLCIGLDFDGTLCKHFTGEWKGDLVIEEGPNNGAIEFLTELVKDSSFKVYILSSRCKNSGFRDVFMKWLVDNGFDKTLLNKIYVTANKPPLHLYIDDRVYIFQGKWPSLEMIKSFKPFGK